MMRTSLTSPLLLLIATAASTLGVTACGDDDASSPGGTTSTASGGSDGSGAGAAQGGGDDGGGGGTGGSGPGDTCLEDPNLCGGERPVCAPDGRCVECSAEDTSLCTGDNAICDTLAFRCGPCRFHEQCPGAACNVFTGVCMTAPPVVVGPDPGDDFNSVAAAVAAVPASGEGILRVKEEGGPYEEFFMLDGDRVVAILSETGRPVLDASDAVVDQVGTTRPVVSVTGATLMMEGIRARSEDDVAFDVFDAQMALDRTEIRGSAGLAILADAVAEVRLRNTIVGGNDTPESAIVLGPDATLDANFSTIAGGGGAGTFAVRCEPGTKLRLRNAIVFSGSSGPALGFCATDLMVAHTAAPEMLPGPGNLAFVVSDGLFASRATGNLRLTASGQGAFENVGLWQDFDPRTDIDGTPRANLVDSSPDLPGAHAGPP
ncbi:MAG: hypothetical protein AAGN82_17195 [Myxococcota bacterium]